ncbi:MAG: hypothetical protein IPJ45_02480 [Ignavibacteria bacterium]|nr:hypothetical protein [Ignavibacteria bacterium]
MKSKDYFRQFQYIKIVVFSKDKDSSANYLYQIGKSYQKSRKYESSIFTFSDLMNSYKLSNTLRNNIEISLGLSYLQWGYLQYAQMLLNRAEKKDNKKISSLYLGLLDIKAENYNFAHKRFEMMLSESHDTTLKSIARKCNDLLSKSDNLSYRKPVFAALLSAVMPGSGQLYSKHYFDAFQAIVFVGASAFATFAV